MTRSHLLAEGIDAFSRDHVLAHPPNQVVGPSQVKEVSDSFWSGQSPSCLRRTAERSINKNAQSIWLSVSFTGACFRVHRRNLIGHQYAFNTLHRGVGHGAAEHLYHLNSKKSRPKSDSISPLSSTIIGFHQPVLLLVGFLTRV
jgi:hypothetical protein